MRLTITAQPEPVKLRLDHPSGLQLFEETAIGTHGRCFVVHAVAQSNNASRYSVVIDHTKPHIRELDIADLDDIRG